MTFSCAPQKNSETNAVYYSKKDSIKLVGMINAREIFMKEKNIEGISNQFSKNITWVNSQGYLFSGKEDVVKFHSGLVNQKKKDYNYKAGKPNVRFLDNSHAIIYYSWNMYWFNKITKDSIYDEIGMMTLFAAKKIMNGCFNQSLYNIRLIFMKRLKR